jgi:hypothetical protein
MDARCNRHRWKVKSYPGRAPGLFEAPAAAPQIERNTAAEQRTDPFAYQPFTDSDVSVLYQEGIADCAEPFKGLPPDLQRIPKRIGGGWGRLKYRKHR